MRHLPKPQFNVEKIIKDCAQSYKEDDKKKRFYDNALYIKEKSDGYDLCAEQGDWVNIVKENTVNGVITVKEMVNLYKDKFAKHMPEREIYYDRIMSIAKNGKCPICGIGQVSTLDHYLAKTLYPTYTVTPCNLVPICKDCNFNKLDFELSTNNDALLHPYYDDIDDIEWLCASVIRYDESIVANYFINPSIEKNLYSRLTKHFETYRLGQAYAVQASTEIAENIILWRNKYKELGKDAFVIFLNECLQSKEYYMKNTWNTALLRALINNVDILS